MRVAVLDCRIQAEQKVAVGAGDVRHLQRIENRLVVFVNQHGDRLPGAAVQSLQQASESLWSGGVVRDHTRPAFDSVQLRHEVRLHIAGLLEIAPTKAEPQHRMTHRPIPLIVNGQPLEQRLVTLEQFLARVQKQTLAKAPWTRQEVVRTLVEQPLDVSGLIDVVAVPLAQLAEGLNADG